MRLRLLVFLAAAERDVGRSMVDVGPDLRFLAGAGKLLGGSPA